MSLGAHASNAIQHAENWITSQRWYGDKARPVAKLDVEAVAPLRVGEEDLAVAMVVTHFSYEYGPDARYFVPVVIPSSTSEHDQLAGGELKDALSSPAFLRWFVEGFLEERSLDAGGTWQWRRLSNDFPSIATVNFEQARPISAEQSNTSIVFDRQFIGKVFRRLQSGENPDLEIGGFLTRRNRFPNSPKLYGLVDVVDENNVTAIAAIQEFIPNNGDGWSWMLGALEDLSPENLDSILNQVRLLAQRTAEMHVALASDPEDPAFAPEVFSHQDAQDMVTRIIAEISGSVEGLVQRLGSDHVGLIHKGIGARMADASAFIGSHRIRVHGDYHLGQTLRTLDDDFYLIDFEGEPSRSMEERRLKQPALKDVAGMLRSLDYAAATMKSRTDDPERTFALDNWLQAAQEVFVSSYRATVKDASVNIVPDNEQAFHQGLSLLTLEKALYEVRYEMNNRPDWLPIPLNALRSLVGVSAGETR